MLHNETSEFTFLYIITFALGFNPEYAAASPSRELWETQFKSTEIHIPSVIYLIEKVLRHGSCANMANSLMKLVEKGAAWLCDCTVKVRRNVGQKNTHTCM